MQLLERSIYCPYCGEQIDILLDDSVADEDYYEDCSVCCRPIRIHHSVDLDGELMLEVRRDDD